MSQISHPNIVRLCYTFQDAKHLYMVMDLCRGGELLRIILDAAEAARARGEADVALSVDAARFYLAEVVCAIQYLHTHGFVHRDLKPENILVCADGHLKLTDFGTAKDESTSEGGSQFVGTAEYVSPEVLRDEEAHMSCDLWALGCILFQMLTGRPPFRGESEYLTFQLINHHGPQQPLAFPPGFDADAAALVNALLVQNPLERLGAGESGSGRTYAELKAHPFFAGLDFSSLRSLAPPLIPKVAPLPEPLADNGEADSWTLAGITTELKAADAAAAGGSASAAAPAAAAAPLPPAGTEDPLARPFLEGAEVVLFSGAVLKKKGMFSVKTRHLVLTSRPRLFYIDPADSSLKGEVSAKGGLLAFGGRGPRMTAARMA